MHKATILDQPKEIGNIDKSDMLGHCVRTPTYCRDAIQRAEQIEIPRKVKISEKASISYKKPNNILIAGMGGSAVGGEILHDWLRDELPIPIEVCKDYFLPAYADENTLAFVISYSGETEETLNAFMDALRRKCMIVAVTSGRTLLSFCERLRLPYVTIPSGVPPRAAIPYLFFSLPIIMEKTGILLAVEKEIEETIQVLENLGRENSPQTLIGRNPAKKLALELVETVPTIYGFRQYESIARRWKTQFNENSKIPSRYEVFPELNHNEVVGWEASEPLTKGFSVMLIRDHDEPPEIRHRIEATKRLAMAKAGKILEVYASGTGKLAKMFSVLHLGNFVSVYLAILQGVDPTPVKTINAIKKEMEKLSMVAKLRAEFQEMIYK